MSTAAPLQHRPDRGYALRVAGWVFLGWTVWALYWLTEPLAMTHRLAHGDEAAGWFRDAAVWAVATLAIFAVAAHVPLKRRRWWRGLLLHVAAAVLIAAGVSAADWAFERTHPGPNGATPYLHRVAHDLRWNTEWYCYLLGMGLALHYHRQARERERQAARLVEVAHRLEARVAGAQLEAARMRMQPEFLFATLDAIAALAPRDPDAADDLTVRLADLLRMVVDSFGSDEVTLARDAAYLGVWAAVRSLQAGGRVEVALEVADDAGGAAVPAFLLQPLAAALLEGRAGEPARVAGTARRAGSELLLELAAPGAGRPPRADAADGVRALLRRVHGPAARAEVGGDGAVRLRLPFREAPLDPASAS